MRRRDLASEKKNQVQGRLDVSLCPFLRLSLAFPLAHDTRYRTKRLGGAGDEGRGGLTQSFHRYFIRRRPNLGRS